jgi:hypothetical protein
VAVTIEQIVCVSIGFIIEAGTFALGLLVGASLRRRDSSHGYCNKAPIRSDVERRDAQGLTR